MRSAQKVVRASRLEFMVVINTKLHLLNGWGHGLIQNLVSLAKTSPTTIKLLSCDHMAEPASARVSYALEVKLCISPMEFK